MSSDSSDDECSYTKSASIFKNIRNKITTDIVSDSPNNSVIEINDRKDNLNNSIIEIEDRKELKQTRCDNSDVISNDNNLDESLGILSTIDAYLAPKSSRKRKKSDTNQQKNKQVSARETRSSKRKKANIITIDTIEIDPDYPIINSQPTIPDDVNYEVTIKVLWKAEYYQKFNVRRFQKLDNIFEFFAKKENVSEEKLLFTIKGKIISKSDSAYTLELNAASIIEGGTLSEKSYLGSGVEYSSGTIELKVQMKNLKKPIKINMKVTDHMDVLMSQFAEEINVSLKKLKFYFDGDLISATDSPVSLQMEGEECIDCVDTST